MGDTNILILSVGTRNKVVQYFVRALTNADGSRCGTVVATDMSELAPAIYDADRHYIVPRMTDEGYLGVILNICGREKIKGVLSLIDPELSLLAEHMEDFKRIGTTVIGSPFDLCEMSLDKMRMYKWLQSHGYSCARSYVSREEFYSDIEMGYIGYPVFVKPVRGSASGAISKAHDRETVDFLFDHAERNGEVLMIQEFLDGQEIGADVYIDMLSGEIVSIFTKRKLKMRAGETDKSESFRNPRLFELIERFAAEAGYRGQIDIDIFDVGGEYYISEVNPRFGGGYPHAYECGVNNMDLIVRNLMGDTNVPNIGSYDESVFMMKYNEVVVRTV